jgi:glycine oxidase
MTTTSELSGTGTTADVIVVGGGVIALTIARELARRGLFVTLIERGELGAEASFAAGGILGPQAEANSADDFFKLACQSRDLYPPLAQALFEETGIDIELDTTGTLYLAVNEKDEIEVTRRYEWQTKAGLPVSRLTSLEARELEPLVADNIRGALLFPQDIQVDNRRLLAALIAANQRLGVRLVNNTKVESLRMAVGRVTGVITSRGQISAPYVVMAAGAWTSMVSTDQSLPSINIEPVRGQMVCLQTRPRAARHILYSPRGYLVPRRDGRLIAGSTTEHAGYDKQVTAGGVAEILSHVLELAPSLASAPISDTWAGLRPRSEDNLPILGPCEIDGLVYATGHYRNGILLAPITGQLIADAIVNKVVSPLLSRFTPHRFDLVATP